MVVKLEVFKTVHNTWPAKNGMAAGESFDLLCLDVSNPPEHRMEELLFYRTKPEEREAHYVNGTGKTITVGVGVSTSTVWWVGLLLATITRCNTRLNICGRFRRGGARRCSSI